MNDNPNTPSSAGDGGSTERRDAASAARRRILRAGLGAAPVLMVSAPRSVMATTLNCVPASSFASINASRPDLLSSCSGRTPGYWKTLTVVQSVARPICRERRQPDEVQCCFRQRPVATPASRCCKYWNCQGNSVGRDALARHIVAALLNAAKGLTPANVLSVSYRQGSVVCVRRQGLL